MIIESFILEVLIILNNAPKALDNGKTRSRGARRLDEIVLNEID